MSESGGRARPVRVASLDDEPGAPLADRLLLALGMSPSLVKQVGVDVLIDTAVGFRTDAHRFPMCSEDYGVERQLRDSLVGVLREIEAVLTGALEGPRASSDAALASALALCTETLGWVDNADGDLEHDVDVDELLDAGAQ